MKVCKLKIDSQGRITLPKTFLSANDIQPHSNVAIEIIASSHQKAVRLIFDSVCIIKERN